jgi:hypothetical protein
MKRKADKSAREKSNENLRTGSVACEIKRNTEKQSTKNKPIKI